MLVLLAQLIRILSICIVDINQYDILTIDMNNWRRLVSLLFPVYHTFYILK